MNDVLPPDLLERLCPLGILHYRTVLLVDQLPVKLSEFLKHLILLLLV
jgi:hypothetical protein